MKTAIPKPSKQSIIREARDYVMIAICLLYTSATAFQQDDKIMLSILDNQGKTKRYSKLAVKSELGNYTINLTQYGVNDVDFRNDTQIAIVLSLIHIFVPVFVPLIITDAPGMGSPVADSVTTPIILCLAAC